ncbi:glycosyltransferase family 25 protein [Psychrobacter sp. AH5]|uniref:glycosyltransferase family 25 protein n=1 Tax=Psychrobacter sp. AH5 TaxID=2937433 RepID=UPI00334143F8
MIKNIVISLTSATERREHIKKEFGKHNVAFEFFDALTPETVSSYIKGLPYNFDSSGLSPIELACMMSHVAIWQKMINENIPYITIFEDDVYLGQDAKYLLNSSEWIKPEWNIIKIETVYNKVFLASKSQDILSSKRCITQLKGKHLGAGGYILSLKGIKLLLDYTFNKPLLPIDEIVFKNFITQSSEPVYQMVPALCIQDIIINADKEALILPSSLEEDRRKRMRSEKKGGLAKISRETRRMVSQTKESLFAKQIPFN